VSIFRWITGQQSWGEHVTGVEGANSTQRIVTQQTESLSSGLRSIEQQTHVIAQGMGVLTAIDLPQLDVAKRTELAIKLGFSETIRSLHALHADLNILLGDILWQLRVESDQLRDLVSAVELRSETLARELRQRGVRLYKDGLYEEALVEFLKAERENPYDFIVLRSIGSIYLYRLIDLPKARAYFEKAAKYARSSDPIQSSEAHFYAGMSIAFQAGGDAGLLDEACKEMDLAVALNPEFPDAHYQRACFLAVLRRSAEATEALRHAIAGDPQYFLSVQKDECFDVIRDDIESLRAELVASLKEGVRKMKADALSWASDIVSADGLRTRIDRFCEEASRMAENDDDYPTLVQQYGQLRKAAEVLRSPYEIVDRMDFAALNMDVDDSPSRPGQVGAERRIGFRLDGSLVFEKKIWRRETPESILQFDDPQSARGLVFDPRQSVAASLTDNRLRFWIAGKDEPISESYFTDLSDLSAAVFDHEGAHLFTVHKSKKPVGHTTVCWRVSDARELTRWQNEGEITSIVPDSNGRRLACLVELDASMRRVELWDWRDAHRLSQRVVPTYDWRVLAFSPRDTLLACRMRGAIALFDVPSLEPLGGLLDVGDAFDAAFDPSGELLYVGSRREIQCWHIDSRVKLASLPCSESYGMPEVAVDPNGELVATCWEPKPLRSSYWKRHSKRITLWIRAGASRSTFDRLTAQLDHERGEREAERARRAEERNRARPMRAGRCLLCGHPLRRWDLLFRRTTHGWPKPRVCLLGLRHD
jgi:tetratricopeptide (TPR) repeat protein